MQKSARGVGVEIRLANGGLGIGGSRVSKSNSANPVFIVESSSTKLLYAAWINAVILPMSVLAKN